jgi:hypothetical protein
MLDDLVEFLAENDDPDAETAHSLTVAFVPVRE